MNVKTRLISVLWLLLSCLALVAEEPTSYPLKGTQIIPIRDSKTGYEYELYIKTPEGYAEDTEITYPVIFNTDASMHMDMLSGATSFLMEHTILVGISYQKNYKPEIGVYASRFRDYSIAKHDNPKHQEKYQFGGASDHLRFIREDIIPYVEQNYRTDPHNHTYFGYSLGGLFGAYILMAQPDTFKHYILGSPSLQGDIPQLSKLATPAKLNANVFISYGSLEKDLSEHVETFSTLLKNRNDPSLTLKQVTLQGDHTTAFPLTAINGITWLSNVTPVDADTPFWDVPLLTQGIINAGPKDQQDGILVGKLGVDGGNKDAIMQLAKEIEANQHACFDSLLIAQKDKLLFESYFLRGRPGLPHPQASTTKAYTSMAVGRAIQLGYLSMDDLHKPLIGFLKNLDPSKMVAGAENITLHKAMTMQSGLRIAEDKMEELQANAAPANGVKLLQTYLENSAPITTESQTFKYQGTDPFMVMQVLDTVVPGGAEAFIKKELLDKMGIDVYRWRTDTLSGLPSGASGASMTSRAMFKFGLLAKHQGKWQGEQLIPTAFIAKAISKIVKPKAEDISIVPESSGSYYGYYWWIDDLQVGDKSYLVQTAQGGGGQYIMWVEALDLIVVVTAHNRRSDPDSLSVLANRIIPAFN